MAVAARHRTGRKVPRMLIRMIRRVVAMVLSARRGLRIQTRMTRPVAAVAVLSGRRGLRIRTPMTRPVAAVAVLSARRVLRIQTRMIRPVAAVEAPARR